MREFDLGKLNNEIIVNFGAFEALQLLLNDQDALAHHAANLQIVSVTRLTGILEQIDASGDHPLRQKWLEDIASSNKVYLRQMIILAVTYLERIIVEFLQCLFISHPSRMYEFLAPKQEKNSRGKVDLNEIVAAESKEALVTSLATRAASIATQGKFRTTINNIERLAKTELDTTLVCSIESLVEQRNRIVHEASSEEVTTGQVSSAFDTVINFLHTLGEIAVENQISCHDPIWGVDRKVD